jgi:predicted phage tail protein
MWFFQSPIIALWVGAAVLSGLALWKFAEGDNLAALVFLGVSLALGQVAIFVEKRKKPK